jgi:hypothetical protein
VRIVAPATVDRGDVKVLMRRGEALAPYLMAAGAKLCSVDLQESRVITAVCLVAGVATILERLVHMLALECLRIVTGEARRTDLFGEQRRMITSVGIMAGETTVLADRRVDHGGVQSEFIGGMATRAQGRPDFLQAQRPHHAVGLVAGGAVALVKRLVTDPSLRLFHLVALGAFATAREATSALELGRGHLGEGQDPHE